MDIFGQGDILQINDIKNRDDNFIDDVEEIIDLNQNLHEDNNKDNSNFTFGNLDNKNVFNSINTDATVDVNSQNVNYDISFFSNGNNGENNNIKNKELTKETIEMLNDFIKSENLITSSKNNEQINFNIKYINNIKDIKNNLFNLDNKINTYFKRPYMRRNIKKIKKQNTNNYSYKYTDENIKNTKEKIKMENINNGIKINNFSE